MLTLIHLSDVHFSQRDDSSQFDLNRQLREAILTDIASKPAGVDYDGLLISGDLAFSGRKDEYESLKVWLGELFHIAGLSMDVTYVVPGNHDVDRERVRPKFPLWDAHQQIRYNATPAYWLDAIQTQIKLDPAELLLTPFHAFNDFAQGCECQTTKDNLSWSHKFPKHLPLDHRLNLIGLNSALISDAADSPGNLLVSQYQTSPISNTPGVVNLVMCHHPPDWLMDKREVRTALNAFAPIALFGHEHTSRVEVVARQLRLFAGAAVPPRSEPEGWQPTYHILTIDVVGNHAGPRLQVCSYTREYMKDLYSFGEGRGEGASWISEFTLDLPAFTAVQASQVHAAPEPTDNVEVGPVAPMVPGTTGGSTMPTSQDSNEERMRSLVVRFFMLATPSRYRVVVEVGLLEDGDDSLDPQKLWAEIFRRAEEKGTLDALWDAVAAASNPPIKHKNPFNA